MKLTTRGRYAVTAMLDLAINGGPQPVSLADISGRQEISLSYLEQLFAKLRRGKLVTSARGPGGGYRLARSGTDIFVAQIIDAVDEAVDVTNCQGKGNCHQGETCLTHDLWADLSGPDTRLSESRSVSGISWNGARGSRAASRPVEGLLQTLSLG